MDQESGVATGRSLISLNENEQRCFSGLHSLCQADSSGQLSASKVGELLRASQLPADTLHQITEVCGAKRLGYFGTGQFYAALKLLAAAQSGLPVCLEAVTADLPLPRFQGMKNEAELWYSGSHPPSGEAQGQPCVLGPGGAAPPWSTLRHPDTSLEKKEHWSPPHSPSSSPPRSPSAYHSYPYALQRNGMDSQVVYESQHPLRPLPQLEQHASPGHYGNKPSLEQHASPGHYGNKPSLEQHASPGHYGNKPSLEQHASPGHYGNKPSLEHQASPAHYGNKSCVEQPVTVQPPSAERLDGQGEDDPWRITEEQRDYYTNQFTTLQPDLGALILGTIAKNFFTKSKLPIPELSHIWELSDVDRDGALTFPEFCTAFHLIVARKNGYPLPESLPPTLRPGDIEQGTDTPDTPGSAEPLIVFEDMEPRPIPLDQSTVEVSSARSGQTTSKQDLRVEPRTQEFSPNRVVITSEENHPSQVEVFPGRPEPPHELDPQMKSRTRPRSYSSTSIDDAMKKAEEPPTPPPRPQKTHSRASSLDLNKLFQQGSHGIKSGWLPPPPALPPRPPASQLPLFLAAVETTPQKKVPQPNFADFSHFREEEESISKTVDQSPLHRAGPSTEDLTHTPKQDVLAVPQSQGSAPQKPIRRKYRPDSQNLEATPPPSTPFVLGTKSAQKLPPRQKREIQTAIRKKKETNAVLTRLNSELQQQLKEVHQERISLESQLEILRPLASV